MSRFPTRFLYSVVTNLSLNLSKVISRIIRLRSLGSILGANSFSSVMMSPKLKIVSINKQICFSYFLSSRIGYTMLNSSKHKYIRFWGVTAEACMEAVEVK